MFTPKLIHVDFLQCDYVTKSSEFRKKKSEVTHSVPWRATESSTDVSYLVNAAGMSSEANEKHSWEIMMEHLR